MIVYLRKHAEDAASALPALLSAAREAAAGVLHGNHPKRRTGTGERFWQFREYQHGDRPQDIDWRQSARGERIYIRQKESQIPQTNLFWCDPAQSMDFKSSKTLPTKAETAKIITLALSILMTKAGEQVGLLGTTRRGRSGAMVDYMGGVLSDHMQDLPAQNAVPGYRLTQKSMFIAVSDFLEPPEETARMVKTLSASASSGLMIQVLDPAEIELPYDGRTVFEEPSIHARETVDHVASIREAYRQRLETHIKALEDICARHDWLYILHRTDRSVTDTLALIWAQMNDRHGGR